jgi:hypothetical protein
MADDNRSDGQRGYDPYARRRAALTAASQEDPLAELARLIGQQSESGPTAIPAPRQPPRIGSAGRTLPSFPSLPLPSPSRDGRFVPPQAASAPYEADPYDQDRYDPQGYDAAPATGYGHAAQPDPYAAPQGYADPSYDPRYDVAPAYGGRDAYAQPRYADDGSYAAPHADAAGYQDGYGYADPRYADAHAPHAHDPRAAYADQQYGGPAQGQYEQDAYAQGAYAQGGYAAQGDGQGYAASGYAQTTPDYPAAYYGAPDAPKSGRFAVAGKRGSMVTVLAVLALAVLGTAGAFGYRAMFGGPGTSGPPPVIKADPNPTKIVPATDARAKPIQDRIGGERMVSREEQPIQMPDTARGGAPRTVFPHLAGDAQGGQISANIAAPAAGPTEPKRIRTVAIRPDGTVDSAAARQPAQPSARNVAPFPDPANARAQAIPPSANAPLPLSPNAVPVPQPQPQRQAARTPPANSPFPAPITGSANPAAGAFAVQVSSQRSESEAQASYRSLQQRFPAVLGSREPLIRRADLGEKGVYYRAQIPFGSQGEANEFCNNLKAAGGQCVVQRN